VLRLLQGEQAPWKKARYSGVDGSGRKRGYRSDLRRQARRAAEADERDRQLQEHSWPKTG